MRRVTVPLSRVAPFVVVGAVVIALATLAILFARDPIVREVAPLVLSPGQELRLAGDHFGDTASRVTIAGRTVSMSSVTRWTNTEIVLRAPADVTSGLLYVETERGRSNGTMIRVLTELPRTTLEGSGPASPRLDSLERTEVVVGGLLTINGRDFGVARRGSRVTFAMTGNVECETCDQETGYALWSDTRIVVRVPDGVASGLVNVSTPWGSGNPLRYTVDRPAGTLEAGHSAEIGIRYGAEVASTPAGSGAPAGPGAHDVVVRLPRVAEEPFQRSVRIVSGSPGEHRLAVSRQGLREQMAAAVVLLRHEIRSRIDPARVVVPFEMDSGFTQYHTRPLPGMDAGAAEIRAVAARMRTNRTNPYRIAEASYAFVLDRLTYAPRVPERGALAALETGLADDLGYATLFVSILRAAGVPARVIGGLLVTRELDAYPHFWAEYFVTSVGWVPVDPALGGGAFPGSFPAPPDPRTYYFGNLDAWRVSFGPAYADDLLPALNGARFTPDDPYTLQLLYVAGGSAVPTLSVDWLRPRAFALLPSGG